MPNTVKVLEVETGACFKGDPDEVNNDRNGMQRHRLLE